MLLRAADRAFGHRLMMDVAVPGGVAADIAPDGAATLRDAARAVAGGLPALQRRMEPLLARLEGLGVITAPAVGGVVGRAAGHGFDARALDPAYGASGLAVPTERAGDAASRCRVRLAEIADSLRLLGEWLRTLPDGPTSIALPPESGEGIGCAE